MKKKLFFLFSSVALMCITLTANAQVDEGKYYIKNVGAGLYWGAGNNWGTQASLVSEQQYATLAALEDGTYTLESMVSNGGNQYYFNGSYMDNGSPVSLTITKLDNGNYTIANGDVFYGYDGTSTVLASLTSGESENAQWKFLTEDEINAERQSIIAAATADKPADVTFLITDAYFGRNRRDVSAWTMEAGNKNLTGGGDKGGCAESYHSTFSLSQVIANAPKGVYKLGASAFYRQDGADEENLPYIYITDGTNTATSPFGVRTGTENNMNAAADAFNKGSYVLDPAFFELSEAGDITVGAKLEENTNLWCIWGRFTLSYYGPDADIATIQFGDLAAKVEELRAQATELKGKDIPAAAVTALEEALAASETIEATKEAYNTAIAALQTAVDGANAFVKAKPILDAMKAEIDKTNVYTAEAYEEYYGQWVKKFDEGTLTAAEVQNLQDPSVVTGWHAGITVDNFLLSAWDTNPDFVDAPYYINSWSVEGDNDGTGFRVPFFEYWTGDGNSLGEKTLTATLSEVPAGEYVVSAWVRVRAKNGTDAADATGITLAANGGEAVDVTEGEAVGQFNLGEYKANATVGEDGELKIQFNVAADNNISWLSFKNVKYLTPAEALAEELQKNYEKALPTITDGNYYEIFAEVGETTYYLTSEGKLTADEAEANAFEFKAEKASGTKYATGWSINKFTNPSLSDGSTGDITNDGALHMNNADRNSWERQVFFLQNDKYAVRSTNATGTNWGANTYWTVVTDNELPEAGYALAPNYTWQLKDVTAPAALAAAKAVIEEKEGVGTGLFQIPEDAYNTYAAAVEAAAAAINAEDATAESIAAAVEALKAAGEAYATAPRVAPKAGKPYTFALTTSDGTYALSISSEGIKIVDEETETYIVAQEDGTFAIANSDGEYVNYAGGNNWTMAASTDAYGWTISAVEGGYTIQGKNGLLGTNTSDGAAAGSPCYGDKKTSNGYVVWSIAEGEPEIAMFEWMYDFEADKDGVAIVGAGSVIDSENEKFGKVFQNVGGSVRTNYLTLPEDLFSHSTESKQLSIGFWVSANGNAVNTYTYAPFFTAYASNTNGSANTWPMLALQSRGNVQVNCEGWCDFDGTTHANGRPNIYNQNAWEAGDAKYNFVENWLEDNEWHLYTVTFTETNVKQYLDGAITNEWNLDGSDGQSVAGLFSNGANLKHICLGGNQAWDWLDGDAPFLFDDVFVTNYILDEEDIFDIIAAKKFGATNIFVYNVERIAGQGYTAENISYSEDETDILEALDATSWDEVSMYPIMMTTGEVGEDFDGWRDVNGDPMSWNGDGTDLGLCLKYPHDGAMALCTHPGNDPEAGEKLSAGWAVSFGEKKVVMLVNVEFVNPEVIDLTFDDLNKVDEITVGFESETGRFYEGMTSDVDVAAVLTKLDVESLNDVTIYAVQSDGSLDSNYKLGLTDGWRNAEGDWQSWGDAAYFYVKADFSKANTQLYEIGGYPGKTDEAATYTATYVFVKSGSTDAVVLKVALVYTVPTGLVNINTAAKANGKYLEKGKVVIIKNGVKYNAAGLNIK